MLDFEKRDSAGSLGELSTLAQLLLEREAAVAAAEKKLAQEKKHLLRLREESIPCLMSELQLAEITLEDGRKVKVTQEVYCSITEDNKEPAFAWLNANGFGGLIKSEVGVAFGREGLVTAHHVKQLLSTPEFKAQLLEAMRKTAENALAANKEDLHNAVREAMADLNDDESLEAKLAQSVHAQTLKTFVKEQLKLGNEALPLELFSARPVSVAKVVPMK